MMQVIVLFISNALLLDGCLIVPRVCLISEIENKHVIMSSTGGVRFSVDDQQRAASLHTSGQETFSRRL